MAQANNNHVAEETAAAPFQCSYCQRIFSRIDHLGRHVRTHTQEKPYPCHICGKSFARIDLVKRHATQHVPKAPRTRLVDSQRRSGNRVDQACRACAASKLKCSQTKPCQRCIHKNILCEYESTSNATRRNPSQHHDPNDVLMDDQNRDATMVDSDVAPMSPMSVPVPSQPTSGIHMSTRLAHEVYTTYSASTSSLIGTPSANSGPDGDCDVQDAIQNDTLSSFEESSTNVQDNFCQDEITADYSEILRDLLGSAMTSPVACDGGNQTDITFWDAFMENDERLIDIGHIPLLDLQPCDMDGAEFQATETSSNEHGRSFDCVASAAASQAFRSSGWDWGPSRGDSTSAETSNLILPLVCSRSDTNGVSILRPEDRNRLLLLLLHRCAKEQWIRITPRFPSELFLDQMLRKFFASQRLETVPWFHIPSFQPNVLRDELLAAIVSIGAGFTQREAVQRFGYTMAEIIRYAVVECWTTDNTTSRDIQLLQAWRKWHDHSTIIRRARWLRRDQYRVIRPKPCDEGEVLQNKWNDWIGQESRKRLVYRTFVFDAEMSMNNHVNPLMSYAEMHVPFPDPNQMWWAATAEDWKREYTDHAGYTLDDPLTLADTVRLVLSESHANLNLQSCHYTLYGFWSLIWEFLQLYETTQLDSLGDVGIMRTAPSLMILVRRETLTRSLHTLCVVLEALSIDHSESIAGPRLVLEYLSMALLVPLKGLQAFAGRDGEREARRVYPALQAWAQTQEARQAIWHAGQIYKIADALSNRSLRGTCVLLIYQASITLWVYGIMAKARWHRDHSVSFGARVVDRHALIWLNGADVAVVQKFIAFSEGIPALHPIESEPESSSDSTEHDLYYLVEDANATMRFGINLLKKPSSRHKEAQHAIIGSITRLMLELAKVAEKL